MRTAFRSCRWLCLLCGALALPGPVRVVGETNELAALTQELARLREQGKSAEAIPLAENLLALVEKTSGSQSTNTASQLNELAGLHQEMSAYAKAEVLYQRARAILEAQLSPEQPQTATVLADLGALYIMMDRLDEAEPLLQRALGIRTAALPPDHADLGTSHSFLGWLYVKRGDYQKSETRYQEALRIRQQALGRQHADTAGSLNDLALLYDQMGDFARAEPLYREALKIREEILPPTHPDLARSYNDLALFYKRTAHYSQAEAFYVRAIKIKEEAFGPESSTLAISLNNFGTFYMQIGDYGKAEPLLLKALHMKLKLLKPEHPSLARAYHNLGLLYEHKGEFELAETNYLRDVEISEKGLGSNHVETAISISGLGGLYYQKKDYERAEAAFLRALAVEERILAPDHPATATSRHNLARLYADTGRLGAAKRLYQRSLEAREKTLGPHHDDTAKTLDCLARLSLDLGDRATASSLAARATEANEAVLANLLAFTSEEQRLRFQRRAAPYTLPATLGNAESVAAVALHNKGVVLDSLLEDHLMAMSASDAPGRELTARLRSARRRLAETLFAAPNDTAPETWQRRAAASERLRAEVEAIESAMARQFAGLGRARRALAVTVEQVRAVIPTNAALVEFIRYSHYLGTNQWEQRYGAVVLARASEPVWVGLGGAAAIEKSTRLFQHLMRGKTDESALADVLRGLFQQTWSPLEHALPQGTASVILCPDAELNFVSFATFLDAANQFLGQKYSLGYVASGRDLLGVAPGPSRERQLVIYANPDFDAGVAPTSSNTMQTAGLRSTEMRGLRDLKFSPLRGAEREARRLEANRASFGFDRISLHLGKDATESKLNGVESPFILHLATHGFFLPELNPGAATVGDPNPVALPPSIPTDPMHRSGLALAGAQRTMSAWASGQPTPAENDGVVTAREVGALNLHGTWLVAVSACDTGAGEAMAGEGVLGLRRGFLQAGAQNLLLTLWPIDDDQTADLVLDFYTAALRAGDAASALAAVQARWLDRLRKEKSLLEACRIAGPFILSFQGAVR